MSNVVESAAWQDLVAHQQQMRNFSMQQEFVDDKSRFANFSLHDCGILFDFSKNLINRTTIDLLLQLAKDCGVTNALKDLVTGSYFNHTERRAILHSALRAPAGTYLKVNNLDVMPQIHAVLSKMAVLVSKVHDGSWLGFSDKRITDIVNIGIGGSFLGSKVVTDALAPYANPHIKCHYLSSIDDMEFNQLRTKISAETTLFIISSKTFTTLETIKNANLVRKWYLESACDEESLNRHFVAVTANVKEAISFGINPCNVFPIWDFVGGRFSLWSATGLPIALSIGMQRFTELLTGAYSMDQHVQNSDDSHNMPLIMALLGIWYSNFWGAASHAVCPYSYLLRNFNDYLKQLEMESNGKSVNKNGEFVDYSTCPIIWGGFGNNGQHAYYQLLHQGTHLVPTDFIVSAARNNFTNDHHTWLYANCLAQAQSLMCGKSLAEVEAEMLASGATVDEINRLAIHKVMTGNKPTNMLVLDGISPHTLGALLALYEYKVFIQSVIWQVNAFDQFGVELGKQLSINIYQSLTGMTKSDLDSSTAGLVAYFRNQMRG